MAHSLIQAYAHIYIYNLYEILRVIHDAHLYCVCVDLNHYCKDTDEKLERTGLAAWDPQKHHMDTQTLHTSYEEINKYI